MKLTEKTIKRLLIFGLICALGCALVGIVAVAMGYESFIVAVICGVSAALPVCAELSRQSHD
ncbi:MAG: hypothetical protein ACI4MH_05045 [Candidatus Coproplasma sp.]